ncbi:hypothetical protein B0H19DRAFT_432915 [Mycena capillaripes]|nr:hypothetical protein B0H19DRAFT_432915 [Mycena capillaripes]
MNPFATSFSDNRSQRGSTTLMRADGLWFEDCGLIVRAEKTLFRISKHHLASHSPIFRDMLLLPQPPNAEMMDGCPLVHLPDSAEDVTFFLKALMFYDFFEPYPAPTTFSILTSILRMSHKYQVDPLRKRALIHLSSSFPTTLLEYQNLTDDSPPWITELRDSDDANCDFDAMVLLARELSIDWILPVVFYRICEYSLEEAILEGKMHLQDKTRAMTGARMLEAVGVTKMLDFLWPLGQNPGCYSAEACAKSRYEWRHKAEGWRDRHLSAAVRMPLEIWEQSDWDRLDVCDVCMSSMKVVHEEAKQSLWDGLPEVFGLPAWSELERLKAEAFK